MRFSAGEFIRRKMYHSISLIKHCILREGLVLLCFQDGGPSAGESDKKRDVRQLSREASEDNEVFGM